DAQLQVFQLCRGTTVADRLLLLRLRSRGQYEVARHTPGGCSCNTHASFVARRSPRQRPLRKARPNSNIEAPIIGECPKLPKTTRMQTTSSRVMSSNCNTASPIGSFCN